MCVQAYEECAIAQGSKQAHFVELGTAATLCECDEPKKCVEHDNGDGILKDHIGGSRRASGRKRVSLCFQRLEKL